MDEKDRGGAQYASAEGGSRVDRSQAHLLGGLRIADVLRLQRGESAGSCQGSSVE